MNKNTYDVRFFTKDIVNGEVDDEHLLAHHSYNKYMPIPNVGDIVLLEDTSSIYRVKEIDYCYPSEEDVEYEFEIDVIVEVA